MQGMGSDRGFCWWCVRSASWRVGVWVSEGRVVLGA
jgi:hypothetical protein